MTEYGRIHKDGSRSGGQPVLSPCPFCGGKAFTQYHGLEATYSVECEDCLAKMPYVGLTEAEAIAAWNTRQPTQSDALREKIKDIKEAWDWWQDDTLRCASVVEDAIDTALQEQNK